MSRLIGAAPGYVGFDEGGQLTEAVRRKPYCVLLFDEIEKAHPDVFNIFLQILDDGQLTDSHGRTVNFKNTIIIMTSNIGSDLLLDAAGGSKDGCFDSEALRPELMKLLRTHFRPEFLNRVDATLIFKPLTKDQIRSILDLQIAHVAARLADQGIALEVDEAAKDLMTAEGYDPGFGARPIKRVVVKEIETPVSRMIISGMVKGGMVIKAGVNTEGSALVFTPVEKNEERV